MLLTTNESRDSSAGVSQLGCELLKLNQNPGKCQRRRAVCWGAGAARAQGRPSTSTQRAGSLNWPATPTEYRGESAEGRSEVEAIRPLSIAEQTRQLELRTVERLGTVVSCVDWSLFATCFKAGIGWLGLV